MPEIRKADPQTRARSLRLALVVAVAGFSLFSLFLYQRDGIVEWLESHLDTLIQHSWLVFVVMVALLSPLIVFGGCLLHLGNRIVEAKHYPLPDMPVARDTEELTGDAAVRRGRLLQGLAMVLIITCLVAAIISRILVATLLI